MLLLDAKTITEPPTRPSRGCLSRPQDLRSTFTQKTVCDTPQNTELKTCIAQNLRESSGDTKSTTKLVHLDQVELRAQSSQFLVDVVSQQLLVLPSAWQLAEPRAVLNRLVVLLLQLFLLLCPPPATGSGPRRKERVRASNSQAAPRSGAPSEGTFSQVRAPRRQGPSLRHRLHQETPPRSTGAGRLAPWCGARSGPKAC